VILEKGWIMGISSIDYKESFCSFMQPNKIMCVF